MKLNVFEDGDKIGEVEVDITNHQDIQQVMNEYFDCGELEEDEVEISVNGDEVYVSINEQQYLWNKE
jgi:hypothetical protein